MQLSETSQAVLDLMVKYGDKKGFVDYGELDQAEPDWKSRVPKNYQQTMSGLRRSGRFDQARAGSNGAEKPEKHHTNGKGHATPAAVSEVNVDRLVKEKLEMILRQARFCTVCGNNHGLMIRAAMIAAKLG